MRVIAIAAKGSPTADVAAFTRERFGAAPVSVYLDGSGGINRSFGVSTHPTFRFVTAGGRLTTSAPGGFPLR